MVRFQSARNDDRGTASDSLRRYDALYARYSSHAQDDSTSVAVQIEACERASGHPLRHFIDQAKTGRTTGGRTELLKLIQEAEAGRIGRLYVYKFDRLGRAAGTHVLVEDLESCGVEVISVTEGTNALARGVQLVVAADYSRVLADRTRAGLVQRHKEGCWTGGPPPYGYRIVLGEDGRKRLAIDDVEAEVVRFVFETYLAESVGLKEVARRLRQRGVATRLGGPWGFGTVRSILTNRALVGEVRYLRRRFKLDRESGRRIPRPNEESLHAVNRDESLRIVADGTFQRAQEQLSANAVDRPRGVAELRPFTRHLFCSHCGSVCYSRKSKNHKGEYRYYACGQRQAVGPEACPNSVSIREDRLLQRVQLAIGAVFGDVEGLLKEATAAAREMMESKRAETDRLKSELAEVDRTLQGLGRVLIDADIDTMAKRSISRQMAEAEVRRDGLRAQLGELASQSVEDAQSLSAACREAIDEAQRNFAGVMSAAQLNRFVGEVIGPMHLMPDGRIVQKPTAPSTEVLGAVGIVGEGWSDSVRFRDPETGRPDVEARRVVKRVSVMPARPETECCTARTDET